MGRGRAKAKQQKVARELKYSSHFTDLDALQRELGTSDPGHGSSVRSTGVGDESYDDEYEDWTGTDR